MPLVRRNNLGKFASSVRRKRTGVIKRAKFQAPTARNQKNQILGNAMAIRALKRIIPPAVWTDYSFCFTYGPFIAAAGDYQSVLCDKLTNLTQWTPVMRRDANALVSSTTLIKRMQINLRYELAQSNWVQATTFIVSLRKDASNRDPSNEATLVQNEDYIISTQQGLNARLNPAVFKVHYARNVSMMSNAWRQDAVPIVGGVPLVSNSALTFAKGQVNLKLNMKVRQPSVATNWKVMQIEQLPPSQRLYILTFFKGNATDPSLDSPSVSYDCLNTCYNSS